jgi:hypothetical protein
MRSMHSKVQCKFDVVSGEVMSSYHVHYTILFHLMLEGGLRTNGPCFRLVGGVLA